MGYDCKHVAAIVIAVAEERVSVSGEHGAKPPHQASPDAPLWEQSLRALVDGPAASAGERPLAIELSMQSDHGGGS